MFEALFRYINSYSTSQLTREHEDLITRTLRIKKFRRKQYLLQEGQVCQHSAFILKGATRQYTVDEKGVEHIVQLCLENWWAVDRESYIMLTPSIYNIDAWEDTDAILMTNAEYLQFCASIPAIQELSRRLDERSFIATQKRLNASLNFSAEQRYYELASRYPEFLQRFPQHAIASYLGITAETLSRIRQAALKK
jgi:CRP-like cAMP-binding protein